MKKILFMIGSLGGGGAEKTLLELVKNLDKDKYDVTVKTIHDKGIYRNEIKNYVTYESCLHIYNNKENVLTKLLAYLIIKIMSILPPTLLYKIFIRDTYDVEIAYLEGMSTKIIAGSNNKKSKKFAWVHADPLVHGWSTLSYVNLKSEIECYKKFDEVYCVSNSVKESFENKFSLGAKVQFNVLDEKSIIMKSNEKVDIIRKNGIFRIISIGRLAPQKGYERLLRIHKKLIEEGHIHELLIIGEGEDREKLQRYINEKNLSNSAFLLGFRKNPYKYLKDSDLFVCSSFTEGFSTVATEAIILGVPIVTTDCAGMEDLLGKSEYGIITNNNENDLYKGIKKILLDDSIYKKYKTVAKKRGEDFKMNIRLNEYERILGE